MFLRGKPNFFKKKKYVRLPGGEPAMVLRYVSDGYGEDTIVRATSHTSQEPWPWTCESPKKSVQRPSQHISKIM